jgi:hypothetical protein
MPRQIPEERTRKDMIDPQLERAGWYLRDHSKVKIEIPEDGYDAEPWNGVVLYQSRLRENLSGLWLGVVVRSVCQAYRDIASLSTEGIFDGGGWLRRVGRHLGVNPQSVANWAKAHAEKLPSAPMPEKVEHAELEELYAFIGEKKTGSTS